MLSRWLYSSRSGIIPGAVRDGLEVHIACTEVHIYIYIADRGLLY